MLGHWTASNFALSFATYCTADSSCIFAAELLVYLGLVLFLFLLYFFSIFFSSSLFLLVSFSSSSSKLWVTPSCRQAGLEKHEPDLVVFIAPW